MTSLSVALCRASMMCRRFGVSAAVGLDGAVTNTYLRQAIFTWATAVYSTCSWTRCER